MSAEQSIDSVQALLRRLEQLNDVGVSLSSEDDLTRLLEKILVAAKSITRADAGTLYLVNEDAQALRFEIVRTDSLGMAYGGVNAPSVMGLFPDVPLVFGGGRKNLNMVAAYAANTGETVCLPDAYTAEGFDFSGTRAFDEHTGYRSRSFLTVPMRNHEGQIIGVLQLINALDAAGQVQPFTTADQRLVESLASQAAIALTNRHLIAQLEELFEAFIRMINLAIDEKSPHTSTHCQRVPELTMMLAEAVNATKEGPLADFHLSERDRYELRIAAMLHDCGKIATPVHVVDKATKLQTLFDRIELIASRFQTLKRDAEIEALQARLAGEAAATVDARLQARFCQLDEDLAFLRHANVGTEKMGDEALARVKHIAASYFLTDETGKRIPVLSADELENLSIRAGTLTQSERDVINHHIVATIRMLEQLPWPGHMRNVPEYAGGHHERMDGKGYPRGLTRHEMSWQARMMGIADIFEALTSRDRPYKPAMKLSQALGILENFKNNGHIDPDLHDIFVSSGVFRKYASHFMSPDQVDC